jgi:hypothetical protein
MIPRHAGLALLLGTLVLIAILVWIFHPEEKLRPTPRATSSSSPRSTSNSSPGSPTKPSPPATAPSSNSPTAPAASSKPAPVQPLPANFPADRAAARDVVDHVQFTIRDFRLALSENPVGDNSEITRALLGDNRKQIRFAIPEGSTVNGSGQLCDPWGTPYFFHALARDHMEVRSAGPDQKMWTDDDIQQ